MKPCPFCAEDIQDQAVKCKHCGSTIPVQQEKHETAHTHTAPAQKSSPQPTATPPQKISFLSQLSSFPLWVKILLGFVALGISASATLAGLATWYIVKKTKWSKRNKIIGIIVAWILAIGLTNLGFYLRRAPKITITFPASGTTATTAVVNIEGSVDPKDSEVLVWGTKAAVSDGRFSQTVMLKDETNIVTVVADNSGDKTTSTITLLRHLTPEDEAEFTIDSPKNGEIIRTSEIEIKGTVANDNVRIAINNNDVDIQNRTFSQKFPIVFDDNKFTIQATNVQSVKTKQTELVVNRQMTAEEKQAQAESDRAAKAKVAAEKAVCDKDKACRLCREHADWSRIDCEKVATKQVWVGMEYDMLVEQRGKPNRINPSNYGRGTLYQYCWDDYTPMCFYDNNGDDRLDSFN